MKYETGNIWNLEADGRCIPTNGMIRRDGNAVMGAGLALQAAIKYPELPRKLGKELKHSNKVYAFPYYVTEGNISVRDVILYTVPTKHHWKDKSDIVLIEKSLEQLAFHARAACLKRVLITKLGCGLGGLNWNQVEPLMSKYLDDRFVLVTPK